MILRRLTRGFGLSILTARTRHWLPTTASGPVVVFSPHYDDETLGAGGAIIKLRQQGVPVYVVFMTDGSRSHAQAMDGRTLSHLRREEAIRAAAILGVESNRLSFLEFPEGRLYQHRAKAIRRVAELLAELRCGCVFVPSTLEPLIWSADHRLTTEIVFEALGQTRAHPEVVEYLVWFWYHWPWVPVLRSNDTRQLLKLTWLNALGARGWLSLNATIGIQEVLSRKRQALEEYKTQMTRLCPDKPWPILSDVAQGKFLETFFLPREFFKTYRYAGGRHG